MLFSMKVFDQKHFESQSLSKIVFDVVNGLLEGIKLVFLASIFPFTKFSVPV